jgi:hypothetical protein
VFHWLSASPYLTTKTEEPDLKEVQKLLEVLKRSKKSQTYQHDCHIHKDYCCVESVVHQYNFHNRHPTHPNDADSALGEWNRE